VFAIKDERASAIAVTTGGKIGDLVEIKGVNPGAKLILSPAAKVQDGTAVAPLRK
jgi:hypothetical protein